MPSAWLDQATPVAAEIGRLSPYACLAEAVRNEEKAFAFFSDLAGMTEDPALQALAERLAKEELQHAQRLRQARRKAYRLPERNSSFWPAPVGINSEKELLSTAQQGETAFLQSLATLNLPPNLERQIQAITREVLPALGVPDSHGENDRIDPARRSSASPNDSGIRKALQGAEDAFAFYDGVTAQAVDQAAMFQAQALSEMALDRLKLLYNSLAAISTPS